MQLHQIKREHPNKKSRQIGRGGKRGTTSGRGTKGQLARAGHKKRPELRDIIKKLPKRRGYRFASIFEKPETVSLDDIERLFEAGETANPKSLIKAGLVNFQKGKMPKVKILSGNSLSKKLFVSGCLVSANARELIEKAGGSVLSIAKKKVAKIVNKDEIVKEVKKVRKTKEVKKTAKK